MHAAKEQTISKQFHKLTGTSNDAIQRLALAMCGLRCIRANNLTYDNRLRRFLFD